MIRSTAEMNYRFHVMRPWEHIKCSNRVKETFGEDPYKFTKGSDPVYSPGGGGWQSCSVFARKMNYRFHVVRLREHIKCGNRVKSVAAGNELFEVACERRGIARDIADLLGP